MDLGTKQFKVHSMLFIWMVTSTYLQGGSFFLIHIGLQETIDAVFPS